MNEKNILIVGAGGVLAKALTTEFSGAGYAVFGIRRERTIDKQQSVGGLSRMYHGCLHDLSTIKHVVNEIETSHGLIDVLVYNAAHLVMKPFLELSADDVTESWQASVAGAVASAQAVLPHMVRQGRGAIIFSGATASLRGTARFAAFASAKFALRGLSQALAREYQSQGIHVAHVVIDGLLRGSASVSRFGGYEEKTIDPAVIAGTYRWLVEQHKSAWTLELDIRPNTERF
jgi:NAD(P)-dependent dehydrogenase (short-subunit alcohol dehydrogenase family)